MHCHFSFRNIRKSINNFASFDSHTFCDKFVDRACVLTNFPVPRVSSKIPGTVSNSHNIMHAAPDPGHVYETSNSFFQGCPRSFIVARTAVCFVHWVLIS